MRENTSQVRPRPSRAAFAGRSFMKVWRPGPDAFPKPAQYLDARVEMRERVLKVITSIAEHMSKIECPEGLHFR